MEITLYSSLIWSTVILIGSLDLVIFLGSKRPSSRAFAHSILWVTIWIATMAPFIEAWEPLTAQFFSRMTYYLGSVIAAAFFYFFLTYPDDTKQDKYVAWVLFAIQIILGYIFIFTDGVIYGMYLNPAPQPWAWHFGHFSFLFELFFFGYFGFGIYLLYKKYKKTKDINKKANLKYMLWVIIVGATPPSLMCIVFPRFGYYDLNWFGPVTELIWIPILSYSIIKYRQMNVRAVITEVLAIGMTVVFFINIFVKTPFRIWDNVITFFVFLILAAYLIRGVLHEAKQTEVLRDLNDNLALKVAEQTVEIRKSYELEKKARRDLEKLNETKDQFIMITQHHLRAPVTNIRCELEAAIARDGDWDKTEIQETLENANKSLGRLTKIVDDFLAISTLKVGGKILNLAVSRMLPLVEDILQELEVDIKTKHLTVTYSHDSSDWPELSIDASKMREALLIVIENAVRYNNDGGKIGIETKMIGGDSFSLIVTDTGHGLDQADKEKIFGHLFHRSTKAREVNPIGMGIGLTVARAIVMAHHGDLTIESEGVGKGARVTITIAREESRVS